MESERGEERGRRGSEARGLEERRRVDTRLSPLCSTQLLLVDSTTRQPRLSDPSTQIPLTHQSVTLATDTVIQNGHIATDTR